MEKETSSQSQPSPQGKDTNTKRREVPTVTWQDFQKDAYRKRLVKYFMEMKGKLW